MQLCVVVFIHSKKLRFYGAVVVLVSAVVDRGSPGSSRRRIRSLSLTRAMAGAHILRLDAVKGSLWSEATRF